MQTLPKHGLPINKRPKNELMAILMEIAKASHMKDGRAGLYALEEAEARVRSGSILRQSHKLIVRTMIRNARERILNRARKQAASGTGLPSELEPLRAVERMAEGKVYQLSSVVPTYLATLHTATGGAIAQSRAITKQLWDLLETKQTA